MIEGEFFRLSERSLVAAHVRLIEDNNAPTA
jgi:hypothetical protein